MRRQTDETGSGGLGAGLEKEPHWDWEGVGNSQKGEIKYMRERKDKDGNPDPSSFVHYDIKD